MLLLATFGYLQNRKNGSKYFSMCLWQLKKHSHEKSFEQMQPKSKFKRKFTPRLLKDFNHSYASSVLKTFEIMKDRTK